MTISNPTVDIQIVPAYQQEQNEEQKVLFLGQKTGAGSAVSGSLVQSIGNANEQNALFGENSILANMIFEAKRYNKITRFDAIPLDDDGSAVQATGNFTITGTATEAGSLVFTVGNRIKHTYTISVADTDTADTVGTALETAVNADAKSPGKATNTSGDVEIEAVNSGLEGNFIGLEVQGTVAGLSVAVTAMSGGANNPSLTNVFDVIGSQRYQTFVFPASYVTDDSANTIKDFIEARWNPTGDKILDGVGLMSFTDTLANFKTSTVASNSNVFSILANEQVNETLYKGSALFALGYEIAAQFAAIRALRFTPGAGISSIVTATSGSLDAFGGIHMATYPYHNTPFEYLPLIDEDKMWTDSERSDLKDAGFTVIGNNRANNIIILDSVVTRYKTDPAGNTDLSYKYLNYLDQASVVREYFHNNLKDDLANTRLTPGGIIPNYSMVNSGSIRALLLRYYGDLTRVALVPSGDDALNKFKAAITVSINEIEGKVTITMLDPVITQLRSIDATMQLTFDI